MFVRNKENRRKPSVRIDRVVVSLVRERWGPVVVGSLSSPGKALEIRISSEVKIGGL